VRWGDVGQGLGWCAEHREGDTRNILGWSWEYAALPRLKARRNVIQFCSDDPAEHGSPHPVVFEAKPATGKMAPALPRCPRAASGYRISRSGTANL